MKMLARQCGVFKMEEWEHSNHFVVFSHLLVCCDQISFFFHDNLCCIGGAIVQTLLGAMYKDLMSLSMALRGFGSFIFPLKSERNSSIGCRALLSTVKPKNLSCKLVLFAMFNATLRRQIYCSFDTMVTLLLGQPFSINKQSFFKFGVVD